MQTNDPGITGFLPVNSNEPRHAHTHRHNVNIFTTQSIVHAYNLPLVYRHLAKQIDLEIDTTCL